MREQPEYWPYIFAYAFGPASPDGLNNDGNLHGLTRDQTVLYFSALSCLLMIVEYGSGLKAVQMAREKAVIGGWDVQVTEDATLGEAYFLRDRRGPGDPKISFILHFTNKADPFAALSIQLSLDSGSYGNDYFGAELILPAQYYEAAKVFIQDGDLGPYTSIDGVEVLDAQTGHYTATSRRSSPPARDGWFLHFSADLSRVPLKGPDSALDHANCHVRFSVNRNERML